MKRIISICLILMLGCSLLASCTNGVKAADLMEGIKRQEGKQTVLTSSEYAPALTDFAVRLFKCCYNNGENQLVSPVSVMMALGMTANGAKDETLSQLEEAFGIRIDTLNQYLYNYMDRIRIMSASGKGTLKLANSIWISEQFQNISRDFLQKNADFYDADIVRRKFDGSAVAEINQWVNDKTDGMIPKILDKIGEEDVMFLVNALSFDAEWLNAYGKEAVREGVFIKEDGTETEAEFMSSAENVYIEDENATGFIKYYKQRDFAFIGLLPNEGTSVSDYVSSLEGEKLANLISSAQNREVRVKIPKLSFDYSLEMEATLEKMGITDAFDPGKADFSGIQTGESENKLYISRVLHKTNIKVDENGTKAAAATSVTVSGTTSLNNTTEIPKVYLDRPFVFMLIDTVSNVPFFIGTVMEM